MVFRCLKNYKGKMDFAGPQYKAYGTALFFSIDINHSFVFFHNSLNQHVKIELLIANLKISRPSKFFDLLFPSLVF